MHVNVNLRTHLWMWYIANKNVVGYLIFFAGILFVVHANAVNASRAANLASIVAKNQSKGTTFFLKQCVANKQLLQFNADTALQSSIADHKTSLQFEKYHEHAMAMLVQKRSERSKAISDHFKSLEPPKCEFDYEDVHGVTSPAMPPTPKPLHS